MRRHGGIGIAYPVGETVLVHNSLAGPLRVVGAKGKRGFAWDD
jgi:hypothetical protein